MSRTNDILDKTKRKEPEAKKWKVVVGIVVGLLLVILLFSSTYTISEPIVDEWLSTHPINSLFDFYEYHKDIDEMSVYFVGSSLVATEVYAPAISDKLYNNGYNISIYNLFVPSETLIMRSIQIDEMVASSPDLIIFGISYSSFVQEHWNEEYMRLAYGEYNLTPELKSLYTGEELSLMYPGLLYKVEYLKTAFHEKMNGMNPRGLEKVIEPYGVSRRQGFEETKDMESMISSANNPGNTWRPIITAEETRNVKALRYMINTCKQENIPVIIINMPIHPLLSEKITDESRGNYFAILDTLGVKIIDMEKEYGDEHFWDLIHTTWDGALDFSDKMADLIIQELS